MIRRSNRLLAVCAGVLLVLVVLTMAMQRWTAARSATRVAQIQSEHLADATARAGDLLRSRAQGVIERAAAIAADPDVARAVAEGDGRALMERLGNTTLTTRTTVEVYRADGTLLGWNGDPFAPAMGRDQATALLLPSVQLVREGLLRDAVVAWADVPGAGRVRVVQVVRAEPPVRNSFLRPYRLTDELARSTQTMLALHPPTWGEGGAVTLGSATLARLVAEASAPQTLLRAQDRAFGDWNALWLLLLGLCALAALVLRARRLPSLTNALLVVGGLAGLRLLMLELKVPGRWQIGRAITTPLAPLFDATHFATTFGGGLLRSSGDLMLTAIALLSIGLTLRWGLLARRPVALRSRGARGLAMGAALGFVAASGWLLARVAERVVLDATLDLFARAPLVPPPLHLFVYASLLTLALGLVLIAASGVRLASRGKAQPAFLALAGGAAAVAELLAGGGEALQLVPFGIAVAVVAWRWVPRSDLRLRGVMLGVVALAAVVYPLLAQAYTAEQQSRMDVTARGIQQPRDARALFAVQQALDAAASDSSLVQALRLPSARIALARAPSARLDAQAAKLARTSMLGNLGAYDVTVVFADADSRRAGRFGSEAAATPMEASRLSLLRAVHAERIAEDERKGEDRFSAQSRATVDALTGEVDPERLVYAGIQTLASGATIAVWAEPQRRQVRPGTPFPRALLPAQGRPDAPDQASVALFRDGALIREQGADFGRYRLDPSVTQALGTGDAVQRVETLGGQRFRVRYVRTSAPLDLAPMQPLIASETVVAVRVPLLEAFDHLFFGLRILLAGMLLAIPLWALLRWTTRVMPRPRRFQERVLDAFSIVGALSVVAVGILGLRVLAAEGEREVQDDLRSDLERVEELLVQAARPGELPFQVLQRSALDSLALRAGRDLNVYVGPDLVASSRPTLVRDGLIPPRMPARAYDALVHHGARFAVAQASLGTFDYTAGFRVLADPSGSPSVVVSVPTLPAQERIAEEQARRVAYLLGALLLLFVVVLLTASLLARTLAGPIERLRQALERTARGQYQAPLEIPSDDEIGELVRTFNDMQEQLAESRRRLTQQERQLAWREMARQVAHEIKNPLTPMKLSVQHLRRAFDALADDEPTRGGKFERLFERVTTTIVEQTDALARIAGDFSTFARLPTRMPEPLDVTVVAQEAIRLMEGEQGDAEITSDLALEPLVVRADREELRRVFINLIKNGIQAMDDLTGDRRIRVETLIEDQWAVARVTDTGSGIPDELVAKVFEPNFSTKTSGTGLGLAISRKAVEESGGTIAFQTQTGVGTTFEIRLPIVTEDAVDSLAP